MDINKLISDVKAKLQTTKTHFGEELKKIRTGRANPAMLDGLMIEVYGAQMPLKQVASVTAPEAQLLQLTPFDPNNIAAISDAIRNNQALGFNPMDDGRVVRIPVPPLTTERRQQLVKQLHEKQEETMISARNVRHDTLNDAKVAKTKGEIGEDDYKRAEKQIDEFMQQIKLDLDAMTEAKQHEIMTI